MTTYYDDSVKGHITADDDGNITHIRHSQELRTSDENIPVEAASAYLRDMAEMLRLNAGRLDNLHVPAQDEAPEDRGVEYRLESDKSLFDATTVSFAQTYFDVPVFRRGISVKVKHGPNRVVGVTNNTDPDLDGALPSEERIAFYRDLFRDGAGFLGRIRRDAGEVTDVPAEVTEAARVVRHTLGLADEEAPVRDGSTPATGLMNGRLVAYRYQPELRFGGQPEPRGGAESAPADEAGPEGVPPPFPDIPPVPESIVPGRTYLCAEMIFRHDLPEYGELVWLMLVEVETGSILYIECQTCFVNGLVFRVDPNVGSGDLTVDAGDGDAILAKYDSSEVLHDLAAPVGGIQSLRGTYVAIQNVEDPNVAPPTRPQGADFDFAPRTNDFAAVNAYYHQTQLFRTIADLGFPIATYFDGTTFPIPVDHRVDRFRYAPFRPSLTRRFDRTWRWGDPQDNQDYGSEEILATCHFRIYRSIGGDHPDIGRRRFASRVTTYLILRAIGQLTPGTNPSNLDPVTMTNVPGRGAQLWCEELQEADLQNWISEGLSGGAYNKVIRWAFEKQGSYGGQPPTVDVYIEDGRAGEYPFQQVHWANESMWNRTAPDGLPGHQNAVAGATNHFYMKIKNRGTSDSGSVTVRGFHCLPGAGLTWPNDFTPMSPAAGLTVPVVAAGSAAEVIVGPFEWVPNENVHGHDCVLMIASTDGDPSNVDNFTGTESVQEWRLVPNDNNVGQRNVTIVPGGGGRDALVASLADAVFVAGNNLTRSARMQLRATLPRVLADRGWSLDLGAGGEAFRLAPGEKRRLLLRLVPGGSFTADDLRGAGEKSIEVRLLADGMELGGVRYSVGPDLDR